MQLAYHYSGIFSDVFTRIEGRKKIKHFEIKSELQDEITLIVKYLPVIGIDL